MKTHNEFLEEVKEETRERDVEELTRDALKDDANYNKNEVEND